MNTTRTTLRAVWCGRSCMWLVTWHGVVVCQGSHDFVCDGLKKQTAITFGKAVSKAMGSGVHANG